MNVRGNKVLENRGTKHDPLSRCWGYMWWLTQNTDELSALLEALLRATRWRGQTLRSWRHAADHQNVIHWNYTLVSKLVLRWGILVARRRWHVER